LSAAEKALGRYSSLQDLYLPLQAPMGRQHISQSEIREKADTISIEQLLAACPIYTSPLKAVMLSPLTGTSFAEHQTCSAQLVFRLFAFGVPPLKAL